MESVIHEIQSDIEAVERNEALSKEACFGGRVEAIDFVESNVVERIEGLLVASGQAEELTTLKQRAEMVKDRLEAINENLFQKLRASIKSGNYTGTDLQRQLKTYAGCSSDESSQDDAGYDSLDALVNGLLLIGVAPEETRERVPEMVFYQPTPARIVLELIEKADFREKDVFYDLGSGLGQVVILVNLLSGVRSKGIEFEPAYCEYAQQCARELDVSGVEFINADARDVDFPDGTVFFLYTPFEGKILQDVLEKLKGEAQRRRIRIYTYGPCTLEVSRQKWLERVEQNGSTPYKLAIFGSTWDLKRGTV